MPEYVDVAAESELKDGQMMSVDLSGRKVLLARVSGTFFAVSNTCPHMGGNLSAGSLDGTVVTCPKHGSQFDLRSGEVVRWLRKEGLLELLSKSLKHPQPLTVFQVKVENGRVLVAV